MYKTSMIAAAVVASAATPAAAQEWYVNGGVTFFDGEDATLEAFTVRGGVELVDLVSVTLGLEGEASFGIGDEEFTDIFDDIVSDTDLSLDHAFGGFGVATLEFPGGLDVFARAGVQNIQLEARNDALDVSVEDDETGAAFGVGASFTFFDRIGLRADYTRFESDDADLNQFGVAAVLRF